MLLSFPISHSSISNVLSKTFKHQRAVLLGLPGNQWLIIINVKDYYCSSIFWGEAVTQHRLCWSRGLVFRRGRGLRRPAS